MSSTIIMHAILIILGSTSNIVVEAKNANAPAWVLLVVSLASIILGGGAIGTWMKIRNDRLRGIKEDERLDDAAIDKRIDAALARQDTYIIQPMQKAIDSLNDTVKNQGEDIAKLKSRYRIAIDYIKKIFHFMATEAPEYSHVLPKPPVEIEDELK